MDYYLGRKYREKATGDEWQLRAMDLDEDWFRLRSCTRAWLGREVTAAEFEAEYELVAGA